MLIFSDGFDDRPAAAIGDRYTSGGASAIAAGRTGMAARLTTGVLDAFEQLTYQFTPARQTVFVGVARNPLLSTALCSIRYSGTPQIFAAMNSDGTITVYRFGTPSVALWTSTRTVTLGEFFYIELKGKIDPTDGAWELRIDGERWASGSGVNTSATGDALANQVRLIYDHAGGPDEAPTWVDDFYISDDDDDDGNALITGFAGPVKIATRLAAANGSLVEWTPNTGTNYAAVDDNGKDSDTTYVAGETEGEVDAYALDDLEVPGAVIKAVAVHQWARKDDALPRSYYPLAYVNGAEYRGDEQTLTTDYARYFHGFERNPATGQAWTLAQINAAQIGAEVGSQP